MWKRGFRRYVTNSDDEMMQLPPAEYSYRGEADIKELYEKIKGAARVAADRTNDTRSLLRGHPMLGSGAILRKFPRTRTPKQTLSRISK